MEDQLSPPKRVLVGPESLEADLVVPPQPRGLVVFAQAGGKGRRDPRNLQLARSLHEQDLGTLLFDLLQPEEARDAARHDDVTLLAARLADTLDWMDRRPALAHLPVALFGTGAAAAAAIQAAAARPHRVYALAVHGARTELAGTALSRLKSPTLLVAGSRDAEALALYKLSQKKLHALGQLAVVDGAMSVTDEPTALAKLVRLATDWFVSHIPSAAARAA